VNALEEAIEIGKHPESLYDGPYLKKVISRLIQLIVCERKDHARELQRVGQRDSA